MKKEVGKGLSPLEPRRGIKDAGFEDFQCESSEISKDGAKNRDMKRRTPLKM
jgi:hypothetical protein